MFPKTLKKLITARDRILEEQKKEPLDMPTRQELEWIEKQIRDLSKEPRVTQDGLSREEKIKCIYDVVRPTWFGNTDNESGHTFYDIKYVMIGDVLDRVEINDVDEKEHEKKRKSKGEGTQYTYTPVSSMLLALYKEKRKAIQEQSDYLVDYVYSLLEATTDHVSS